MKKSDLNLNIKILDSKEIEISFLVSTYGNLKAQIRLVHPESVCGRLLEICKNTQFSWELKWGVVSGAVCL